MHQSHLLQQRWMAAHCWKKFSQSFPYNLNAFPLREWSQTGGFHGSSFLLQHLIRLRHFCFFKFYSVDFCNTLCIVQCSGNVEKVKPERCVLIFSFKVVIKYWYIPVIHFYIFKSIFFWHQVIHIFKSLFLLMDGNGCDPKVGKLNPHKPHRLSHSDPRLVFTLCIINAILSPVTCRLLCQWSKLEVNSLTYR